MHAACVCLCKGGYSQYICGGYITFGSSFTLIVNRLLWFLSHQRLQEDRVTLTQRKDTFKKMLHKMNEEYESLKNQLQENETHVEVRNTHVKIHNNFSFRYFCCCSAGSVCLWTGSYDVSM